jgi:phage repressor protein C with HTH and peptisase S24 domain
LVNTQPISRLGLCVEMIYKPLKDVHCSPSYGNTHNVDHGYTRLQPYGRARNTHFMEFKDRIKAARKYAGLNQTELAERSGMTQTSISDLERGKSQSTSFVAQIAKACRVSAMWLATGERTMIPQGPNGETSLEKGWLDMSDQTVPAESNAELIGTMSAWDSKTPLGDDEVAIPLYKEVELAAGGGATEVIEVPGRLLRFAKSTLREAGVQEANAVCATIKGRSMERLIMDGATIGIDTGTTHIEDGEIYAFDQDGMLRVKYLYRLPGGGVRVRSENDDEFPDETLTAEQFASIRMLGWVFWWSTVRRRRGLSIAK